MMGEFFSMCRHKVWWNGMGWVGIEWGLRLGDSMYIHYGYYNKRYIVDGPPSSAPLAIICIVHRERSVNLKQSSSTDSSPSSENKSGLRLASTTVPFPIHHHICNYLVSKSNQCVVTHMQLVWPVSIFRILFSPVRDKFLFLSLLPLLLLSVRTRPNGRGRSSYVRTKRRP